MLATDLTPQGAHAPAAPASLSDVLSALAEFADAWQANGLCNVTANPSEGQARMQFWNPDLEDSIQALYDLAEDRQAEVEWYRVQSVAKVFAYDIAPGWDLVVSVQLPDRATFDEFAPADAH